MEWWDTLKEHGMEFLCGRAFLVATAIFLFYLLVTGVLRRIKNGIVGLVTWIIAVFSPLKLRRLLFNTMSLVFMVGGISLASAARAKLSGGDGVLEAIVGGGFALGAWGFVILLASQFRGPREEKEPGEETPPQKKDRKVKPPTRLEK